MTELKRTNELIITEQERTRELIIQLKQIRKERNLSLQDVLDLVIASGGYTSLSSVKRVFAEGSENQNFRYQETIRPIARGLLGVTEETPENNDISANEIDALKNVILLKDSMIHSLQNEIETLSAKNEATSAHAQHQLEEMRAEHQKKIDYLLGQIERLRREVDDLWTENRRKSKIVDLYVELQASLNAEKNK